MGALTEPEIFSKLAECLRVAAEDCGKLAWHPKRGPMYRRFLKAIEEAEGCARQAFYWRDYDSRWLYLGAQMHPIAEMTGRWMRDSATKEARAVAHPMFQMLSEKLSALYEQTLLAKNAATEHIGPILPTPLPAPHRDTRPVQVMSPGGIILPP